ncbi:MAG TPA: N-acetyltransferase family protein [Leucothrix mucor]|uniref:N-acetyltransferase family protein n=1 Tax=Leucothrix mucor TaxID=45248 RepID=A0A7V2WVQ6_LEUMU|nr:N-acetyltransferase family protein [Leucothrix mucor]
MKIVLAQRKDLDDIVDIYNQAIKMGRCTADTETFSSDQRMMWFNSHTPEKFPLLLAKDKDTLLGYLTISPYREGRKAVQRTAEISYYVHYSHHRKGVATRLMNHALELCPSLNIRHLIAILVGSNQGSIGLLEKHGFERWGCFPEIVEFGNDRMDHLYYGFRLPT